MWDGFYYSLGAHRIAAGLGYSEDLIVAGPGGIEQTIWFPWAHYPVGYSGLIALFLRVFGDHLAVAPVVNAVTGALLAAVTHRVARRVFRDRDVVEERRAALAGLLVALHPGLVLYSGAWMTEPLAALLMMAALWVAVADSSAWFGARGAAIAGVLLGAATLVRPNVILLVPFVGLVGAVARLRDLVAPRRLFSWLGRSFVVGAIALATVAPWTLRNCRVMDACALVSTNAGWNLVIGAAPGATGKFEFLVGNIPEGAPLCDDGGQVAQDRCWFRYGTFIIKRDFRRWLSLIPAKLHYTLDAEWFPINYLREARPDRVSASEHIAWGRALTALQHLAVLFAALACVGRPTARSSMREAFTQIGVLSAIVSLAFFCVDRAMPICWPLALVALALPCLPLPGAPKRTASEWGVLGIVATTLATHAIFFGEDRYHLVVTPAFLLLACGLGRSTLPATR